MKSATTLLVLCLWAAANHAHRLARSTTQRSAATVTFGTTRSALGLRVLHVDAFEQRHTLRLDPVAAPFADAFKLQTTARDEEGRLIFKDVSLDEDTSASMLYQDPESGSVVRVSGTKVEGVISPTLTLTADADGRHEAVRQMMPDHYAKDYAEVPLEERRYFYNSASTREVSSVTVEMYLIVDSTLAAKLGTDQQVKDYLGVFWNAVNQRYATLSDPKIQLVLAGALIIRSAADEPFIINAVYSEVSVDGHATFDSFGHWLIMKNADLPSYDVAYLMTGKDLYDGSNFMLGGKANLEGACQVTDDSMLKYGIGEDNSYYEGVLIAAHEVAHTLGAPDDGDGVAEACPYSLGYLMSYDGLDEKRLQFSSCSKAAMKAYISSSNASCLQTTSTGAAIPLSGTLPGEILSLDKQCQIAFKKSDAHANAEMPESTLCAILWCSWDEPGGQIGGGTTTWPALEGSPCKSGGACRNGSCQ